MLKHIITQIISNGVAPLNKMGKRQMLAVIHGGNLQDIYPATYDNIRNACRDWCSSEKEIYPTDVARSLLELGAFNLNDNELHLIFTTEVYPYDNQNQPL